VVVEPAFRLKGVQPAGNLSRRKAGDEAEQIVGVYPYVAKAARGAGPLRVGLPREPLLLLGSPPAAQGALQIPDADGIDLTQVAAADHGPRLAHERVAGVVVRHRENDARVLDYPGQLFRLAEVEGHRLIAHDVEAGLGE